MRILARVATVALTGVLSVGALAAPAHAAAPAVVSTSPAAGSTVPPPTAVSVRFDQAVAAGSTLTVTGPSNASRCSTTTTAASDTVSCSFAGVPTPTVPDGTYTASYSGRGSGTDVTSGSFTFVVDGTAPVAPTGLAATPSPYLAGSDALTVTGTSESASDKVRVALTGGATRTVSPASDRTFTATFSASEVRALGDGTITVTAASTDVAGNVGATASRTVAKDTGRPTVTSSSPADGASVKPASFAYDVTASEALTQTPSASTIRLFDSTGTELAATVTYPSSTTIRAVPTATLPNGAYTARVLLTDTAGNTNAADGSPVVRTFRLDGQAPAAPAITTPLATVTKANASAWPVSGTGEPGATLTVTVTGGPTASASKSLVVPASGSWSTTIDVSALPDGTVSAKAAQTDTAGNVSPDSATATAAKDTVAPAVTGQAVTPRTMGGGNTLTATVTGSVNDGSTPAGAPAENAAVQVVADDADPSTPAVVANGTSPSGGFSIPVDTRSLADGTITYRVVATDGAGNASTAVTTTNTKDTAAPAAPSVTITPSPVNNANKGSVVVSGSASGTSVRIVLSDTDASTADLVQTATVSNGSYTSTSTGVAGLADGTLTATVTTTDAGGNTSAAGTATATKDTVAPAAPSDVTAPTYVTSGSLPVTGRAEPGSTVRVTVSDSATPAGTASATTQAVADGTWKVTVNVSSLAQGRLTVSATATDAAGNTGAAGSTTTTKDTVAPDQPASVTASPSPYLPSSDTLSVTATTSAGDRAATDLVATIVVSDGASPAHTLTAEVPVSPGTTGGTATASFTQAQVATLVDGTLTSTVTLRDAAGNVGPARSATSLKDATVLAVESTSPAASPPAAPASKPGSISVTFNEAITPTTNPEATRSTIQVTNVNGVTLAGASSASGRTLTFVPSSPLTEAGGPFTVSYRAYDATNTAESVTGSYRFSVDNTPPAAPRITSVTDPVTQATQQALVVRGTVEAAGLAVRVVLAGTIAMTTTSESGGAFSVTFDATSLPDGPVSVSATVQDPSGNTSDAATSSTTKDATSPTRTAADPAGGATVAPPATVSITFSEALGSGTISIPGVSGTSSVSGRTVTFTPASRLADGTYTATAGVTDAVGNPGSGATTFTVDGTPPAAPAVTSVTDPVNLADQGTVRITGTSAESGSRIVVTLTGPGDAAPVTATTTSGSDGAWGVIVDASSLADGTLRATATATDALGNTSAAGAAATATKDTVRPTLVSAVPADGTTVASPTTVRLTFYEPLGTGSVRLTSGDTVVTGTSSVSGSTVVFTPAAPLGSGTYTALATATDAAGNAAAGEPGTRFTVDASGPAVTGLAATAATATANRTTVTGRTEAGAAVAVTVTDGTRTVTATTTADAQGAFSIQVTTTSLADGSLTVRAVATDALGNVGEPAQTTTSKDATLPAVGELRATPTTADRQRTTVTGTRSETSSVVVTATVGAQTVTATVPSGAGAFSVDLDLSGLADGNVVVRAVPTDAAGNVGPRGETSTTRDATRPTVTGLTATATSTARQTTTVSGTRSEASSVVVQVSDACSTVMRTVEAGTGDFTVELDLTALGDGPLTVRATATDAVGNVGQTAQTTVARDVTGPTIGDLAATTTSTVQQTSTVTGTRSEASAVVVRVSDGEETVSGEVPAGTGSFSLALDLTSLADGPLTVTATATDAAGNVGPVAEARAARDVTAPTVSDLAASDTTRSSDTTTVTGVRSETATVALSATDGTRTVTGSVPAGDGRFTATLDLSSFAPGEVTVTARPTDAVGNVGERVTTTLTFVGPPATSSVTLGVSASRVAYQAPLTLRGTVTRPGGGTPADVELTATTSGGRVVDLGSVPVAADGSWTKTLRPSVNATYRATYPGDADNTSSRSVPRRVEVSAKVTASSRTGSAATAATITGTATAATGTVVTLVRRNSNGTVTKLATTRVSSRKYTVKVRLAKGTTRLEVRVAASLDNAAGAVRLNARRT